MLELPSLVAAVLLMTPLMLAIGIMDMRTLRIPNRMVLMVVGVFFAVSLPLGLLGLPWGLPWDVFLWRIAYGVIAFGLALGLYSLAGGRVGGGDLKLIAALAPFLSGDSVGPFLLSYALVSVVGLMGFAIIRVAARGRTTGWAAFDQGFYFPAGLLLGLAMVIGLWARLAERLGWL